jgi:hypothetical protein
LTPEGLQQAGEVWVADIGIPLRAYSDLGIEVPDDLFSTQDRVPLAALTA